MPVTPNLPKKQSKGTAKGAKAAAGAKGKGAGKTAANAHPTYIPPNHCNLCGLYIVPGEMVTLFPCLHMLCFPCMIDHQASTKYQNRFHCPRQDCDKPVTQYEYSRKIMQQGQIKLVPQPRRTIRCDSNREWTLKNLAALQQSTTTMTMTTTMTTASSSTTTAAEQLQHPSQQQQQQQQPTTTTATTEATDMMTDDVDLTQQQQQNPAETAIAAVAETATAATPPPPPIAVAATATTVATAAIVADETNNNNNNNIGDTAKITRPPARKPTEFTTKSIRLQDLERMPRDMRRILAGLQSKVAKVLRTPHEPGKIPAFDVVAYFRTLAPLQSSAGGRPAKDAKIIARNLCMAYNEESLRNFLACWLTPEQAAELPLPDDPGFEIIYGQDNVVFDSTITRLNMGVREDRLKDDEDAVSSGNEWDD